MHTQGLGAGEDSCADDLQEVQELAAPVEQVRQVGSQGAHAEGKPWNPLSHTQLLGAPATKLAFVLQVRQSVGSGPRQV